MGREDQIEEREVLDSIFPEEITDISETAYKVSIILETPEHDPDEEQPLIYLEVSYPEEYPDVAPELNISCPPNAPKNPRLDVQEDRDFLMEALQPTIEENIGMAMVFTLVSALKESAEVLMQDRANLVQAQKEMLAKKAEEEENRKFQGTPVNRETFLEWHARFLQEEQDEEQRQREEKEAEDKKKKIKEEKKLTGRQLWERGLAGKGDDEEEGEDALQAVQKLKIAA
ncbi:RWD domain-containing protein [Penicillium taxi]|uniref:RWD domain-containing protein n=1 Tax=Penicillium taxi TaxID=168475 RepID=UPI0025454FC3|nr:RWD domain-containing protein [Penicillium taxi]KAJ5899138.1 RWD domain-containing protein [Penicillium taxi]